MRRGRLLRWLVERKARTIVNWLMKRAMKDDEQTRWAVEHGLDVSGCPEPYDFLAWALAMSTTDISARIRQDVLLVAGECDHIVPLRQLARQARSLVKARSVTTRTFTAAEGGEQHCQIGHVLPMLREVAAWLREQHDSLRTPVAQ